MCGGGVGALKAYKLSCPVCFYTITVITRHGRFSPKEPELELCPACNRHIVPIVEKQDYPDSLDYNMFKKM